MQDNTPRQGGQEKDKAGLVSTTRKQRAVMLALSCLGSVWGLHLWNDAIHTYAGSLYLNLPSPESPLQMCPEICLQSVSRSCQVDNQCKPLPLAWLLPMSMQCLGAISTVHTDLPVAFFMPTRPNHHRHGSQPSTWCFSFCSSLSFYKVWCWFGMRECHQPFLFWAVFTYVVMEKESIIFFWDQELGSC